MRVDGKAIASNILTSLASEVVGLKQKGVIPSLAVIKVGDDPASNAYIRQKQKAAEQIGAKIILSHQLSAISYQQIQKIIEKFNDDPLIHGIIVQRPLPKNLRADTIRLSKDVDGFLPNSPYPVPVAAATIKILHFVFSQLDKLGKLDKFDQWLKKMHIVVLGRGETAGKPIAEGLLKRGCNVTVIHSHTPNPDDIIKTGDIVISCVGKPNVVRRDHIKADAILLSVGLWRDSDGKLHGDYEEEAIKDLASFYTPTPGGVGPVNVACLMANLVEAARKVL